jgi:excisionase family DNA binding protein
LNTTHTTESYRAADQGRWTALPGRGVKRAPRPPAAPAGHSQSLQEPRCCSPSTKPSSASAPPRFIRRLRTERRITVVKLGKHIRIDSNDLDAYITASRQEPERAELLRR